MNPGRGRRADVVVSVVGRRREVVGADGARVGVASPGGDLVAARRRGPRAVVLAHRDLLTGCNQSRGNGLKTATPNAQVQGSPLVTTMLVRTNLDVTTKF